MTKHKTIGFKACMDDNAKNSSDAENHEQENELITEEEINAQYEFKKHMEEYSKLQKLIFMYNRIIIGTIIAFVIGTLLYIFYHLGAYNQINDNGPYRKVTTINNEIVIVKK